MRSVIICIALLITMSVKAQQVSMDRQSWDFGDVIYWNNDTAWFKVRNATDKDIIFLPTFYNETFRVMFSSRLIEPGQSVDVGIVYYTENRGRFSVDVPLYVSVRPDPLIFRLKGNIRGFDPAAQLRCPVVNAGTEENRFEKMVELEVRDRVTDEILKPDDLWVRARNNDKVKLEAHGDGYRMAVMPGGYRVFAAKKGYDDYLALVTLEPYQSKFIVYMDRSTDTPPPRRPDWQPRKPARDSIPPVLARNKPMDREVSRSDDPADSTVWLEEDIKDEPHVKEHVKITGDTFGSGETYRPDGQELDLEVYRLNNIIFILDVSMSMKRDRKLDNLKASIGILVDALRQEDKLGIVGFSSDAVLVQSPAPVTEKDSIKARLNRMKADGGTNGGAALRMAYALAETHFVKDGNNQIIIATDGLFGGGGMSRKEIEKLIADGNLRGIHLSTIAFGYDPKALAYLQHLATTGGGTYLRIANPAEGENLLLDMVKTQSRKP